MEKMPSDVGRETNRGQIQLGNKACQMFSFPVPMVSNGCPYRELSMGKNEIRLLKITQYLEPNDMVQLTIHHATLDTNPEFWALSYTWADQHGDVEHRKTVCVDDHTVSVTNNLGAALKHIQTMREVTYLWVDALCIDQSNVTERNEQVSNMPEIYKTARDVICWLGEEYEDSDLAFDFLEEMLHDGLRQTLCDGPGPWNVSSALKSNATDKIKAVRNLFWRPYWSRAWVLQELAFGKSIDVHAGSSRIEWNRLQLAVQQIFTEATFLIQIMMSWEESHTLQSLWQDGPGSNDTGNMMFEPEELPAKTLGRLLIRHHNKVATDGRDKVYALLGLSDNSVREKFQVNYEFKTAQVFLSAARFIVEDENDVTLLAQNKGPRCFSADRGLPTWVPDWATDVRAEKSRIEVFCAKWPKRTTWWACAASDTTPAMELSALETEQVLSVQGIRIGRITKVGDMMLALPKDKMDFKNAFLTLYQWWTVFLTTGRENMVGDRGFLDIILCGSLSEARPDPSWRDMAILDILDDLAMILAWYLPSAEGAALQELLTHAKKPESNGALRKAENDIYGASPAVHNRKFMVVDGCECGIAPMCAQEGDLVVVMLGCIVPLVLREREDIGSGYILIGDAYLDGWMTGRAVEETLQGKRAKETFDLH